MSFDKYTQLHCLCFCFEYTQQYVLCFVMTMHSNLFSVFCFIILPLYCSFSFCTTYFNPCCVYFYPCCMEGIRVQVRLHRGHQGFRNVLEGGVGFRNWGRGNLVFFANEIRQRHIMTIVNLMGNNGGNKWEFKTLKKHQPQHYAYMNKQ